MCYKYMEQQQQKRIDEIPIIQKTVRIKGMVIL